MYVGITRARQQLFLTYAEHRMLYNQFSHNAPSRFMEEIPERLIRRETDYRSRTAGDGFRKVQRTDNGRRDGVSPWNGTEEPDGFNSFRSSKPSLPESPD